MKDSTITDLMDAADNGSIPALKELGEYAARPNEMGLPRTFACRCFVMAAFLGDEQARERGGDLMAELPPSLVDAIFEEVEDWICDKLDEELGESHEQWSAELLRCRFPLSELH